MKLLVIATIIFLFGTGFLFFTFWPKPPATVPVQMPVPTPAPTPPKPKPIVKLPLTIPFTSQAPFAKWSDPRQQDGCEEAAVLMAMKWVRGERIASPASALDEILKISKFQTDKYGDFRDTSATDTLKRLIYDYYQYPNASVKTVEKITDITAQLDKGNLVITPMNGRALKNPHFTQPGPERHMVVIKDYDQRTQELITNDPGIRQGENYRYPMNLFFTAIRDYSTGYHIPITIVEKRMIVVEK